MRERLQRSAWAAPLVLAPGLIAAYYLVLPSVGSTSLAGQALYSSTSVTAVGALLVGAVRYRRGAMRPWLLLAGGQGCMLAGDLLYLTLARTTGGVPYPGWPDVFYLTGYIGLVGGLRSLVRRRTPGWDLPTVVDAAVVAVGAGLVGWVYLIEPLARSVQGSTAAQAITVAYPVMDFVLLVLGVRLLLGAGTRPFAFWLLFAWLVTMLAGDTVYSVQALLGVYDGTVVDGMWMFAVLALAATGLHPSMARLDERSAVAAPDAGPGRLAGLAGASLVAPAVLAVQYARGGTLHVPEVVASCVVLFLLVMVRMADLVRTQRLMAITDGLTGLRTRRYLEEVLRTEVGRHRRTGTPFGFLLIDVDHFKRVNDQHGHQAGDRVLVEVARRLRSSGRSGDIVARYGGEEFAVLLPAADRHTTELVAERVHHALGATPYPVADGRLLPVTVSVGGACMPDDAVTTDDLARIADQALYAAKGAGRDRWVVPGHPRPGPADQPAHAARSSTPAREPVAGTATRP